MGRGAPADDRPLEPSDDLFPRDLISRVPAAVIVTDVRGIVTSWNEAAESLYGWTAEEALGRNVSELVVPADERERSDQILARLAEGESWEGEFPVLRRDGTVVLAYVSDAPLVGPDGTVAGFIGISIPLTMRALLEADLRASRDELQAVLQNISDGITVQDPTGRLVYANEAAARLVGFDSAHQLLDAPVAEIMSRFEVFDEEGRRLDASELPGRGALAGRRTEDVALRFRRIGGGEDRWSLVSATPVTDDQGRVRLAVNLFRDITGIKRVEQRLRLLSEAGEVLASSLDVRRTLERLAELVVPRMADWCGIELIEDGRLRNVVTLHSDPERIRWARQFRKRYPPSLDAPEGLGKVARTGVAAVYSHVPDDALTAAARDAEHLEMLRGMGVRSAMFVPLTARGRTFGAIALVYSDQHRSYGPEDLALAEDLARRAALAVDNAALHEIERETRRLAEEAAARTARLQELTASLAGALDERAVSEVVVGSGLAAMEASGGALFLLDEAGSSLRIVGPVGDLAAPDGEAEHAEVPLDAELPVTAALRSGRPVLVRSPEELTAKYPAGARDRPRPGAVAALPLRVEDRPLGVFLVDFARPRGFSGEDLRFLEAVGQQASQALDRVRLYRAEQRARAESEAAFSRLQVLEAISEVGLSNLDLEELLKSLLTRIREALAADRAVILLRERDVLRVRAAIGLEEEVAAQVRVPIGKGIAGTIAATARALVVPDVPKANPVSAYLRERARTLAGVPLIHLGEVIGVLHVSNDQFREFTPDQVRLLELVAARAALAINQASVFDQQRRIAETLQRSLLPEALPAIPGMELAARYIPSGSWLDVGGDWYDAAALPGGRLGIAVGDVVGHGLRAAAVMGQLRNGMRAFVLEGLDPGEVLGRVDRLSRVTEAESMATAVCVLLDPAAGTARYASAGHPPPLLAAPGTDARFLEGGRSVPLGVLEDAAHVDAEVTLPPGATLVLYTDGLVENRSLPIDRGLERLRVAVDPALGADDLADHLLRTLVDEPEPADDIALLVARLVP